MKIAPIVILGFLLTSAPAYAVYKCQTDGRVTYSDQPCANAIVIDTIVPSAAEVKEASGSVTQEKKAAKRLEMERHKREAAEERERRSTAGAGAAQRKKCANFARRQKRANEDVASSTGAANEKAKLKARRINDDYEAACGRWPERELGFGR